MTDILKLLDGSAEDVKAGLEGKSRDDLVKLRAAEEGGKTRKGVLDALDAAINASGDGVATSNVQPAQNIDPSGAPNQIVPDVDMSHPAVDDNPRANTTADQNRIDFNTPGLTEAEAVEQNLKNA